MLRPAAYRASPLAVELLPGASAGRPRRGRAGSQPVPGRASTASATASAVSPQWCRR